MNRTAAPEMAPLPGDPITHEGEAVTWRHGRIGDLSEITELGTVHQ